MIDDHGCGGRMAGFWKLVLMMMRMMVNDYDDDYDSDNENVI